ncbi:MAG: hypothetical protein ACO3I0_08850 [Limisphaerales bacterium]
MGQTYPGFLATINNCLELEWNPEHMEQGSTTPFGEASHARRHWVRWKWFLFQQGC